MQLAMFACLMQHVLSDYLKCHIRLTVCDATGRALQSTRALVVIVIV